MNERNRLAVWDRCEGMCEMERDGKRCGLPASEVHHIKHKKMGGRHGLGKVESECMDNWMAVCIRCQREHHFGGTCHT